MTFLRRLRRPLPLLLLVWLGAAAPALAQAPDPTGDWRGEVQAPPGPLGFTAHLATEGDSLTGTVDLQGRTGLPLTGVRMDGDTLRFQFTGAPGTPTWAGVFVSADRVEGRFTQGPGTIPFWMERTDADAPPAALERLAELGPWLEAQLDSFAVPGAAVAVVVDGEVVLTEGFGLRNVEDSLPVDEHTLFAIGSSTKAFTTFALGQLVDEGLVDWDTPVVEYLPEWEVWDAELTSRVTVRDAVTHRTGLPRHDLAWYLNPGDTREELVARLAAHEPNRELRETWQYNNMMFLTAGLLAGEVAGTTWEDLVRERIFEPLGMDRTTFSVADLRRDDNAALPYLEHDDSLVRVPYRVIDAIGPAGSINSTADDMARWLLVQTGEGAVDGERLVQGPTLREMHTPQMALAAVPSDRMLGQQTYGLGWFIDSYRGHHRVHHGGNIDGFSALVSLLPFEDVGVAVLTNKNGTPLPELVARRVADLLLELEPRDWGGEMLAQRRAALLREAEGEADEEDEEERRVEGTRPALPLEAYAGVYRHPGYGEMRIAERDGVLRLAFGDTDLPLEHWHYEVFSVVDTAGRGALDGARLHFRQNADGEVVALEAPVEPALPPRTFERAPPERSADPAYLARLSGEYRVEGQQPARVFVQGERLRVSIPGQPTFTLEPLPSGDFQLEGLSGYTIAFDVPDTGPATGFTLYQPNGTFVAERVEG